MGGLAKFMPWTYAAMLVGTIAIIGLGIPHTKFGFSGFFSKDAILESAYASAGAEVMFGQVAFIFGLIAAFLTSFYSWRLIYMTFHGPHVGAAHHGEHNHANGDSHKPHESPAIMLVPLALLAIGAMAAGVYFYEAFVDSTNEAFWAGAIYRSEANHVLHDRHDVPEWVLWAPLAVTLFGLLVATLTYFFNRGFGARLAASGGPLHALFSNKWYFDEMYQATLVRGSAVLGNLFWKADKHVIDAVGPDGVARFTKFSARRVSALHSGYLYHYAFIIIGAALVFGAAVWLRFGVR